MSELSDPAPDQISTSQAHSLGSRPAVDGRQLAWLQAHALPAGDMRGYLRAALQQPPAELACRLRALTPASLASRVQAVLQRTPDEYFAELKQRHNPREYRRPVWDLAVLYAVYRESTAPATVILQRRREEAFEAVGLPVRRVPRGDRPGGSALSIRDGDLANHLLFHWAAIGQSGPLWSASDLRQQLASALRRRRDDLREQALRDLILPASMAAEHALWAHDRDIHNSALTPYYERTVVIAALYAELIREGGRRAGYASSALRSMSARLRRQMIP